MIIFCREKVSHRSDRKLLLSFLLADMSILRSPITIINYFIVILWQSVSKYNTPLFLRDSDLYAYRLTLFPFYRLKSFCYYTVSYKYHFSSTVFVSISTKWWKLVSLTMKLCILVRGV